MNQREQNLKIVVLSGGHSQTHIILNSLKKKAEIFSIEIEDDYGRMNRNRYKRYGFIKGLGQKLFIKFAKRQKQRSKKRIDEIIDSFHMNTTVNPPDRTIFDIHDESLPQTINSQQPDLIVLNCASIIPLGLLDALQAPVLNVHAGITPLYRGLFGAYWALRDDNHHLIGSTNHKVDRGIDTGEVLNQTFFSVTKNDNFSTYHYLHLAYSLKGLHEVLDYYRTHNQLPEPVETDLESKLRTHPTLYGYLFYRLFKGIN